MIKNKFSSRNYLRILLAIFVFGFLFFGNAHSASAANKYWTGTGTWNAANANWGSAPGGPYNTTFAAGDTAIFEGTAGTVTVSSPNTVAGMTFNITGYTLSSSTITPSAATFAITLASGVSATVSSVIAVGSSTAVTLSMASGNGTLTLSGANTFTGTVTINSGATLKLGASSTVNTSSPTGTVGVITVASGGALDMGGFSYTSSHTQAVSINGTGISGAGAITNSGGASTLIGPVTFVTAASVCGQNSSTGTIALTGTIVSGTTGITFCGTSGGSIGTVIAGARTVTKEGTGSWSFSGANTYSNGFTLKQGTAVAGVSNVSTTSGAFGPSTSAITLGSSSGGTASLLAGTFTVSNTINLGASAVGTLTIGSSTTTSAPTFSSPITLNGNNLTLSKQGTTGAATFSGGITGTGNLTFSNTTSSSGTFSITTASINNVGTIAITESTTGTSTFSAVIGSNVTTVSYTNTSSGGMTFSGANTFTGGFTLRQGISYAGVSNATTVSGAYGPSGTTITLGSSSGGTARLLANTFTVSNPINLATSALGTLTIGSGLTTSAPTFSGAITLNGNNLTLSKQGTTGTATFSTGGISGTGNLTLSNTGTSGVLTVSGGITITGNIDVVNNSTSAGTVNITTTALNNSGTFTNTGTSTGTTTVSSTVGANVTTITENSTTAALSLNAGITTTSGTNKVFVNSNASGSALFTISGGITGTGTVTFNNNSSIAAGITVSTTSVNNSNTVTNSGSGTGGTTVSTTFGANVTSVIQNSSTSALTSSGASSLSGSMAVTLGTLITGNTTTVGTTLTIGDGGILSLGNFAFTVNGATTVGNGTSGQIKVTAAGSTGTLTFADITVNAGGIFDLSLGTHVTAFGGNIVMNGSVFNTGYSTTSSFTASKAFSGSGNMVFAATTQTINSNFVITNNNTGTVNFLGALAGGNASSEYDTGANSITRFMGTVMSTGILKPSASANTIIYGYASPTCKSPTTNNYYHLTFSGPSGSITCTITTTAGNVTVNGAHTWTTSLTSVGGNFNVTAPASLILGAGLTVTGDTNISGTLNTSNGSSQTLSTAHLFIQRGGTLTANASTINLTGTSGVLFTPNGTFTAGTSNINMTGNGNATINDGSASFYDLTSSGTGTKTASSADWLYRKSITINKSVVSNSDQTNFPLLVYLATDSDLVTYAQADGDDIKFTDSGGTQLNHQIETYNSSTGQLRAWVKIPTLSASVDTVIYMYYGNANASNQQNPNGVWDSNFKGVWHLSDGTTLSALDATSTGLHGTISSPTATTGQVDGGALFDGTRNFVHLGNTDLIRTNGSISGWVYVTGVPDPTFGSIFTSDGSTGLGSTPYVRLYTSPTTPKLVLRVGSNNVPQTITGSTTLSLNTWYHVAGSISGNGSTSTMNIYLNGVSDATQLTNVAHDSIDVAGKYNAIGALDYLHSSATYLAFTQGKIDELRVSNSVRSADWFKTEYNNQNNPASFQTVGGHSSASAGTINLTVTHNLAISAGTLDDGGAQIVGNGTGTFTMSSGTTLKLGSATTATTFPSSFTNGNTTLNAASTVVYQAGVNQTISGTPSYGGLTVTPISGTPTYTLGAATTINGATSITGGAFNTGNFDIIERSTFAVSGSATVTLGSSTINLTGNSSAWNYTSSGAVTANTSTIKFVEGTGSATAKSFAGNGKTYNNIWFAPATSGSSTGTITISGSNTFAEFKDDNSSSAHTLAFTAGTTQTLTTWTVSGTSGQLITLQSTSGGNAWNLSDTTGANMSAYISLQDSAASGGATWGATNSVDVSGNSGWGIQGAVRYWVGGSASWDGTAGSKWSTSSGGAGGASIPDSVTNVVFDSNSGSGTVTIASGNTGVKDFIMSAFTGTLSGSASITVSGSLTLGASMTNSYTGSLTFGATSGTKAITSNGKSFGGPIIFNGSGGTFQLADTFNTSSTVTVTAGTFDLSTATATVGSTTSVSGTLTDSSATGTNTFTGGVTVNSGGVWSNTGNPSYTFAGGLTVDSGSTFSSGSGTYTFATGTAQTIGGTATYSITNLTNNDATGNGLTFSGAQPTITTLTQGTNAVLTFSGTVPAITTLTATASPNTVQYTGSTQTIKGTTYHHLISSATGTKTLGAATIANGNITISAGDLVTANYDLTGLNMAVSGSATVSLGSSTITLTGTGTAWNYTSSGGVTAGTSTIKFTDSSSTGITFAGNGKTYNNIWFARGAGTGMNTISGDNTFADFKDDGTGVHTITFTTASTTTISSLTLDATSGLISLVSSSPGNYWNLVDTAGTNQVRYVSITDSCASGGATWDAYTYTADNTNGGHNCGWDFVGSITISGTSSGLSDGTVIKVAVNGSISAATGTVSSNVWSFNPTTSPSTGQSVIIFADNVADSLETTVITKYDGTGNITGVALTPGTLTIGSIDNQSIALLNIDDYTCANDEDVMYSVISNVLNVEGQSCAGPVNNSYTGETLSVLASNTLTVATGETVTTEKINNAGTITPSGTTTFNVNGTSGTLITNTGTLTLTGSTVVMDGDGSAVVNSASQNFNNLTSSGTGTKTLGAIITVGNNLAISDGTLDDGGYQITGNASGTLTMSSGTTLKLGSSGTGTTFPTSFTNGNMTLNSASTVLYQSGQAQTVSGTPTYGNLTITPVSGSPTMTLGATTSVAGNLTISTSGILQLSTFGLSVTGTTGITGTLNDNSATGTNSFTGLVTVNSAGTWTNTNNPAFSFSGGLTVTSGASFSSGSGTYTFATGTAQTIGGTATYSITNLTNNDATGNGLTFSGAQPTITTLTQGTNAVLTFSGTVPAITTLTATASPNTVQYTGGTQTIIGTTYHHLSTSNSGVKTLGGNTTVNGNLTIGANSTLDPTTSYTLNGAGTNVLTVNGTARVQHIGFVTSYSNFETMTLNSGSTVDYTLNGTQTVTNGIGSYANLNISTGGTKTVNGGITITGNLTVGTGATFDPLTYAMVGSGTNTLDVTGTIGVGATNFTDNYSSFETKTFNAGSTVNYGASAVQNIDGSLSYVNLTTNGSGVKTLGANTTVTGNATIGASTTLDPTTSYTLTGSGTNVLTNNGTLRVQHSTFAGSYPSFETKTLNSGSVVDYALAGSQTVDSTLGYGGIVISSSGTKSLNGVTTATDTVDIQAGTLTTGGSYYNLNAGSLIISGGTFLPSPATVNLTGIGTVFSYTSGTFTAGDSIIKVTDSSSSSKTFAGGGRTFNEVVFEGTGTGDFIIGGSNTFKRIKINFPPHTLKFTAGSAQTLTSHSFDVSGIPSAFNVLKSTIDTSPWTVSYNSNNSTVDVDYISLRDSTATGGAIFYASSSTNVSGNTGWVFTKKGSGGGGNSGGESSNGGSNGSSSPASGTAVVSNNVVTSVNITSGGAGYTSAPSVNFCGGGGSGAVGTAVLNSGAVTSVTINSGGSNYTSVPTVQFGGSCGGGAGGGGGGGGSSPASGTAVLTNNAVSSVTIDSGGSGYSSPPSVSFCNGGGSGAVGTAVLSGGSVESVTINNGGSGYSSAPTVVFGGSCGGGGGGGGDSGFLWGGHNYLASVGDAIDKMNFSKLYKYLAGAFWLGLVIF